MRQCLECGESFDAAGLGQGYAGVCDECVPESEKLERVADKVMQRTRDREKGGCE